MAKVWATANQPLYFPAIYMIERFARVDHLILMEEAQFSKFGHQSRMDIVAKGGPQRHTVPLKDRAYKPLNVVEIDQPEKWFEKLQKTLTSVYNQTEYFKQYSEQLYDVIRTTIETHKIIGKPLTQAELCIPIMLWALRVLKIECKVHRSLQLIAHRPHDASLWIAELCKSVDATEYIGGKVARDAYMDLEVFENRGVTVHVQDYKMRPYTALNGEQTDGCVAFIDPLFLYGPAFVRDLVNADSGIGMAKE